MNAASLNDVQRLRSGCRLTMGKKQIDKAFSGGLRFVVGQSGPYLELCEIMNKRVPGDFDKKTLLVTTEIGRAHV